MKHGSDNKMYNNDCKNLEIIAREIEAGEDLFVFRVFDEKSHRWTRLVANSRKELEKPAELFEFSLNPLCDIADEMVIRKKLADIQEIHQGNIRLKATIEVLRPKLNLIVFGAGHVGQAVALIGAILGYDVVLIDDRAEFATRKRVPDSRVQLIVGNYSEAIKGVKIGSNSAIVIVTRGHQYDEVCLRSVIRSQASYLGMIGSKRRVVSVMNRLKGDGFSESDFRKVHAPIGLHIGAKSPQEIAVAIHAEIVEHFNLNNHQY